MSSILDDLNEAVEAAKPRRGRPPKERAVQIDIVEQHGTVLVGLFKAKRNNGEFGWFRVRIQVPLEQLMEHAETVYEGTKSDAVARCHRILVEAT